MLLVFLFLMREANKEVLQKLGRLCLLEGTDSSRRFSELFSFKKQNQDTHGISHVAEETTVSHVILAYFVG